MKESPPDSLLLVKSGALANSADLENKLPTSSLCHTGGITDTLTSHVHHVRQETNMTNRKVVCA